jgi:hypothetical protein
VSRSCIETKAASATTPEDSAARGEVNLQEVLVLPKNGFRIGVFIFINGFGRFTGLRFRQVTEGLACFVMRWGDSIGKKARRSIRVEDFWVDRNLPASWKISNLPCPEKIRATLLGSKQTRESRV